MPRCVDRGCGRWRPDWLADRGHIGSGFRVNGRWHCSRSCIETSVRQWLVVPAEARTVLPQLPPPRLGGLLRHLGHLGPDALNTALEEQRRTGMRLGEQLRALGLIAKEALLRALGTQAGVSYLTAFDVTKVRGCCPLAEETVRALGLIPFEFDEEGARVSVICRAPVPKSAVRALASLTGWSVAVYLVEDSVWAAALETYRAGADGSRQVDGAAVSDSAAAIARIVDTVIGERISTMRQTHWDRGTWVRIEGQGRTRDLCVGRGWEGVCQGELTAH